MSRMRIAAGAALALSAATLIPAAAFGGGRAASTHVVTLSEFRFHPGALTIRHGDSVKWVWQDQVEHNVTGSGFHSRTQVHGTYTIRFTRRGTYNYRCTIHVSEGMRGKIIVR